MATGYGSCYLAMCSPSPVTLGIIVSPLSLDLARQRLQLISDYLGDLPLQFLARTHVIGIYVILPILLALQNAAALSL
jgi:hypothetical protein